MCGITGIVTLSKTDDNQVNVILDTMNDIQRHRGPDASGKLVHQFKDLTIGLGHQRLAILDLSPRGIQPMYSPCRRYAIVFNGEIYNYLELKNQIDPNDPILTISDSDTAVLLALLARKGPEAISLLNGMWSFLFIDFQEQILIGSRDRAGQKPLYYYKDSDRILFSSEVKTIMSVIGHKCSINTNSIARFLFQSLQITDNNTFVNEIKSVPPATFFILPLHSSKLRTLEFNKYWYHPYELGTQNSLSAPPEKLLDIFDNAVKIHTRSDVPVGILLSGGLDSSAIVASTKALGLLDNITLLSVTSSDPASDESYYINLMAKAANAPVVKFQFDASPELILSEIDKSIWYHDQPVSSLSTIAHRLLMAKAKELGITVLLNGQAADEQLAGYNKFLYFKLISLFNSGHPLKASKLALSFLLNGTVFSEFKFAEAKRYIPLLRGSVKDMYAGPALLNATLFNSGVNQSFPKREFIDFSATSLPSILHYEDRMSMSYSREMRVPFLDSTLIDFFGTLKTELKLNNGWTKYLLRKSMVGRVPDEIIWRKDKRGFTVPNDKLFRGPLKKQLSDTLNNPIYMMKYGLVNAKGVNTLLKGYMNGDYRIGSKDIFTLYALERWLEQFDPFLHTSSVSNIHNLSYAA